MITPKLHLHATNVHQGGGKTLLEALLVAMLDVPHGLIQLDHRMPLPAPALGRLFVKFVKPSVLQRLFAEWRIAKHAKFGDVTLCFGNLPPLFKLNGRVVVFVQNRYLVDKIDLSGFPLKTRLRLKLESRWLSFRLSRVSEFIVQTQTMKILLGKLTLGKAPIHVLPFVDNPQKYERACGRTVKPGNGQCVFAYVASGEPHKNHQFLLEAWCLLAQEDLRPSLILTLDYARFPALSNRIKILTKKYQLSIVNLGWLNRNQVSQLYSRVDALIYPSLFESFGLPLIEARQVGLPILASELDFVRDVVDPDEVFDPSSPLSIARAVKRYISNNENPLVLQSASSFLKRILETGI